MLGTRFASTSRSNRRAFRLGIEALEDRRVPAVFPSGFAETVVASGLSSPTAMEFAPDGRLFVAEQGGRLRVIKNGSLLASPFVQLNVDSSGERGLLGIAFDPNFAANQFVYLYYTVPGSPAHNRVSRFTASGDGAAPGSEVQILNLENLSTATNHNGGAIHFGLDNKLYVAVGDNANSANAQTLGNRLGKVLRINADGTIPGDNPFVTTAGANPAIWTYGLRNPYTFAVQPGTGRIFINDVGQSAWEEINDGIAGSNYGWPTTEGPFNTAQFPQFRHPLFAYPHSGATNESGCAISGGAFYNPASSQFPADYAGDYFFADYCNSWIRQYDTATGQVTLFGSALPGFVVDLKVDDDGSLYYLARGGGGVVARVQHTASQAPTISQQPAGQTASIGQSATFSVGVSGTAPLSYQWQRDGQNIDEATSSSYTTPPVSSTDNGARFRVIVSNAFGQAVSDEATLTVVANQNPTATITAPPLGTFYTAGQTITFAGAGTDPEDGALPASAFTWQVDFHHDDHTHPFLPPGSGFTSGSFVVPTTGETSANVFYRILLTVRDSAGLAHTTFRDVFPRTVTITLATKPAGLALLLDGQPVTGPTSFVGVVGMLRTIEAVSPQNGPNGRLYAFARWSDGGARVHTITTPAVGRTYTASFRRTTQAALARRAALLRRLQSLRNRRSLLAARLVVFPSDSEPIFPSRRPARFRAVTAVRDPGAS